MSYIKAEDVETTENIYGKPVELQTEIEVTPKELTRMGESQHAGRAHDITLFIFNNEKLLFIAKHCYPRGLFRAPSGAALPGESLIEGAKRETLEETGATIEIEKYILRIKAKFSAAIECIDWTSHVFKARYISGEIEPYDTHEIREAKFVERFELAIFDDIFRKVNIGGFRYRSFLTRAALGILCRDQLL